MPHLEHTIGTVHNQFKGDLDEFLYFERALTAVEVSAIYARTESMAAPIETVLQSHTLVRPR